MAHELESGTQGTGSLLLPSPRLLQHHNLNVFPLIFKVQFWLQPLGVQKSLSIAKRSRIDLASLAFFKVHVEFLKQSSENCFREHEV